MNKHNNREKIGIVLKIVALIAIIVIYNKNNKDYLYISNYYGYVIVYY